MLFFFSTEGSAKSVVIGTSLQSGNITPFETAVYYSTTQSIYSSTEIGYSGSITSLSFYVSKKSPYTTNTVKIYLGKTENDSFVDENDFLSFDELTEVYSGAPTLGASQGWEDFKFHTPFEYDGKKNLVVVVCKQGKTSNTDLEYQYTYFSGKKVNMARHSMTDSGYGTLPGTGKYDTWSWRANIKLVFDDTDDSEDTGWTDDETSDCFIDGIHYRLDTTYLLATVIKESDDASNYSSFPSSKLTIPSVIYYKNTMFVVRYIDEYAFAHNTTIKEIVLGNNIMEIGDYAFYSNKGLTSVNIPKLVKVVPAHTFQGCSSLEFLNIEESSTALTLDYRKKYNSKYSRYDFYGTFEDIPLDSVIIKRPVTYSLPKLISGFVWDDGAPFGKSTTLRSVVLGENVSSLGKYMFYECTNLQNVYIIGNKLEMVDDYAFSGCKSIKSLRFPESTRTFGIQSLRGLTAKPLIFLAKNLNCGDKFLWQSGSSIIWAYNSELGAIRDAAYSYLNYLYDIDNPIVVKVTPYLKAVTYSVDFGEYFFIPGAAVLGIKYNGTVQGCDEEGFYNLSDLEVAKDYYIDVEYTIDAPNPNRTQRLPVSTLTPEITVSCDASYRTETTLSIRCNASSDETCSWTERGIIYNGAKYTSDAYRIILKGLEPDTNYDICGYAVYDGRTFYSDSKTFKTKAINLDFKAEVGPTNLKCQGMYDAGDANIIESGYMVKGNNYEENTVLTGLEPDTDYEVSYYVRTANGHITSVSKIVRTKELELTTLQPKCVSPMCAIVAATTNISEEETNVGFKWKKYGAPASLAPKEGYASVYNGQLEGSIKNLQSDSYYNVRAFYKSDTGNYYYGDWVTFDPSDYSYFEPTVHTYEAVEVGFNSAKVKAYVLAGTDEIIEQGFEYWLSSTAHSKAIRMEVVPRANEDVNTVLGTGQVMVVTLTDLQPNSEYTFRSFVKTASGTTYGEEQTLITKSDPTGIENAEYNVPSSVITGYYDLEGRKHNELKKGVNIIRYSDGSVRKVLVE